VTAAPGHDRSTFTLVCDTCGHRLPDIESALKHWAVVWKVLRPTGWTGSALPSGPHHCPQCTVGAPLDADRPTADGARR
jgi:anti-sigma B factor antagonist